MPMGDATNCFQRRGRGKKRLVREPPQGVILPAQRVLENVEGWEFLRHSAFRVVVRARSPFARVPGSEGDSGSTTTLWRRAACVVWS